MTGAALVDLTDAEAFAPVAWLRNQHIQSILPTSRFRRPFVLRRARALLRESHPQVLDCGEGVRLSGWHASHERAGRTPADTLVLLMHGWEGSAESVYVLSLAAQLYARGYDVFRLNFRDHGGSHALNPGLFHSCRLAEIVGAARRLAELHPTQALIAGGFSLGGNFALRVAARAPQAGFNLARAFAVCPVLRPHATMQILERGWFVYRQYFIRKWKRSLRLKQAAFPDRYDLSDILSLDSLTAMTDVLVRRYSEYPDIDAYLDGYALVGDTLAQLDVPSHVLLAKDDPIIPIADLAAVARSPALRVTLSTYGGHCGFLDRYGRENWVERWVLQALEAREPVNRKP